MKLNRHVEKVNLLRAFADFCAFSLAWMLAYVLRFQVELIVLTYGKDSLLNYLSLWPLLVISYLFVFIGTGSYGKSLAKKRIWDENFELAKKHTMAFLIFVTLAFFVYENRYSRVALLFFFFLTPLFLFIGRSVVRKINRLYGRISKFKRSAIVIGQGPQARKIKEAILSRYDWNLELVATHSFAAVGELDQYLEQNSVDIIFIVPNADETLFLSELYTHLDKSLSEIILIPYLGEKKFFEHNPLKLEGITAISLNSSNLENIGLLFKRVFDVCFSLFFILVFSPVYLICAFLVKFSSPGPICYKQERMGIDGKKFNCLKFRSMPVNAEANTGPVWAKSDDNRPTAIGKWLRKTSLDEIPQFFNVLMGDMSVVGPRPERPVFVANLKTQVPGYLLRHKVKTGITGWAQINGWRGSTSLEKRIECDLWYIQNWSLWLDLKIVLLTPFKGFVHPNAY